MLSLSIRKSVFTNAIILVAATVFLSGVCARADVRQEDELLAVARSASQGDDLIKLQSLEPKALEGAGAGTGRRASRLNLTLRSTRTKVYEDRPECIDPEQESKCQKYRLVVYARSRGVFVVAKLHYESVEYLLVDDVSGDETALSSFPIFSPSGQRVLVLLMNDNEFGFAIQVWRRDGKKFIREWQESPHADGMYTTYTLIGWPSEDTIEIRSDTNKDGGKTDTKRFSLHRLGDTWDVVESP